jgi:hypothetical protein
MNSKFEIPAFAEVAARRQNRIPAGVYPALETGPEWQKNVFQGL